MSSHRGGVTLPDECWAWLRRIADRDGSSRDDLLEGIVLLAMDAEEAKQREPHITCPRCHRTSYHPKDIEEGYCANCHAFTTRKP